MYPAVCAANAAGEDAAGSGRWGGEGVIDNVGRGGLLLRLSACVRLVGCGADEYVMWLVAGV